MAKQGWRRTFGTTATLVLAIGVGFGAKALSAGQQARGAAPAAAQQVDQEYTKKIIDNTPDKRILTELVDHMPLPADPKVPSPLKLLGYIPGENGNLTYSADIYKYLDALDAASARVTCWSIGKTEEGRDMRAVRDRRRGDDQATSQKYKEITAQLTDPRKTQRRGGEAAHRDRQADLLGDAAASTRRRPAASRC